MERARWLCAGLLLAVLGLGMRASAERPVVASSYGGAVPVLTVAMQMPVTSMVPDFTLTLSQQALSVARGGSSTLGVKSEDANGFNGQINLTCSGMPSGTSCAFSPVALDPSGNATLTVTATTNVSPYRTPAGMGLAGMVLSGLGLVGVVLQIRRESIKQPRQSAMLWRMSWIALLLGLVVSAMGCGYSSKSMSTAVGTKNVMVVGTSGTLSHSAPFSLTVN